MLEADVLISQEYREKITSSKSKLDRYFKRKLENESKTDAHSESSRISEEGVIINYPNVKLPKLKIEPFDGKYENWQGFWGQFEGAIHENKQLSKIDKFNYLKSFLKDSALKCIQGLTLTQNNYDLAVELLKERFGSERTFVDKQISRKLKLEVLGQERLSIFVFGSKAEKTVMSNRVKVNLRSVYNSKEVITLEAIETPCISEAIVKASGRDISDYCKRMKIQMADESDSENLRISLLIGSDYFWTMVTGKIKRMPGSLVGMETKLGYVFNGSDASIRSSCKEIKVMKTIVRNENIEETEILKKIFDLESLGISSNDTFKDDEV
ncbi:hypothetical protein X975_21488, partial [Stegodyphus mimosarum]